MRVLERLALCAPLPTCLRGSCLCAVVALLARVGGTLLVIGCPPVAHMLLLRCGHAVWWCSVVLLQQAEGVQYTWLLCAFLRALRAAVPAMLAAHTAGHCYRACLLWCRQRQPPSPPAAYPPLPCLPSGVWKAVFLPTSFPFLCPPFNCSYTREKRERPSAGWPAPTLAPAHQRAPNIKGADSLLLAASSRSLPARAAPGCSPSSWPSTTWTPSARPWW